MSAILEFLIDDEKFEFGQVHSELFNMVSQQGESSENDVLSRAVSKSYRTYATSTGIWIEKPPRRWQRNGTGPITGLASIRR